MVGTIEFSWAFSTQAAEALADDAGYRVYILGNFSGLSATEWRQRKITRIDFDNFEQILADIVPTLKLSEAMSIQFSSLDDFHPDVWLKKIPLLVDLQQLKAALINPKTAVETAAKIQARFQIPNSEPAAAELESESQAEMLERLLGKKPQYSPTQPSSAFDQFIKQSVAPHITHNPASQHPDLLRLLDLALTQCLQALLHHPAVQALEALWRMVDTLVKDEYPEAHSFYLLDISHEEFSAEAADNASSLMDTILKHVQNVDEPQRVLLIGDYLLSSDADKALLGLGAKLAAATNGYFLVGADPELVEATASGEGIKLLSWQEFLRQIPAERVVLTYPRYLVRLPYGNKRDPIDSFEFEECGAVPQSGELLWGNAAFLAGRAWLKGQDGQINQQALSFQDIPSFSYTQDGEQVLQVGTEAFLTEAQAQQLLAAGISPLLGFRQRPGARFLSLINLANNT